MQLGPFQIDHPFILAPMAGITNSPYRRLMRRMQSSVVISELISANGLEHASQRTIDLFQFHEEERVVGIQIFGEHAEALAGACRYVEKLGADFVDLNLGCPVPKITKKGAGSAMCRDLKTLAQVLTAMVQAVKIPVTIKIRTGWDESTKNAHEVVRVAADCGVRWVAVHGRTRAQGYSGDADWDFIGEIKAKSSIPILGNGDLNTAERAVEAYKKYGVDAVLIGRGALRNPWIFEQAAALLSGQPMRQQTTEDFMVLLELERELFENWFGPEKAFVHARKHLAWLAAGFPGCHEFRRQVFSQPKSEDLWRISREFFAMQKPRGSIDFAQPFLMGGHG